MSQPLLTRYLQPLLAGRRSECFELIHDALKAGAAAESVLNDVVWPAMVQVERLFNDDRINTAIENMACRINRTVADQVQTRLPKFPANGRRALITCAEEMRQELGAQMIADLFQARGWEVFFIGGGVPHDEILSLVGELRPHVMVVFGTSAGGVPAARRMIEIIRDIGVCPTMNIIVSGGVFNRADGLWQEVGADVFAPDAHSVLTLADETPARIPGPARLGIVKKRRRRRKATSDQTGEAVVA